MSLIVAESIYKDYKVGETSVRALDGLSFEIEPSSFVSLVGPSGSGKTTLLNLIGCLDKPTAGIMTVNNKDISVLNRRQRALFRGHNIGFIFQDFNLIPILTVYENVEFPLLMVKETPAVERKKRVMELLEEVGIMIHRNKFPDQISGGQKQRVAIARALVTAPKIVLADEPTANLDSKTAFVIIDLMKRVQHEFKTTFIFSTHDRKIVRAAETIYTLEDGKITDRKLN